MKKTTDNTKQNIGIGGFFAFAGLVLIIINVVLMISNTIFMSSAKETTATIESVKTFIVNKNRKHNVIVSYTAEGKHYSVALGEYDSSYRKGQQLTVYYNPENPSKVTTGKENNFIMLIVGIVLLIAGGGIIIFSVIRKRKYDKISAEEVICSGKVTGIITDNASGQNGIILSRAECCVEDNENGETYYYTSDSYDIDLSVLVGHSVAVYVNKNDRSKARVDINSTISALSQINQKN